MKYNPILYEVDPRTFLKEEVIFYKDIVSKTSPRKILELGVGTGRIFSELLSMVEYGVGIDISRDMLDVCREKCKPNLNYELYEKTFVNFDLNDLFDLIYIPFNTFQHLLFEEEQIQCLKSVRRHMQNGSIFVLDVMNPDNLAFELDSWKRDYSVELPNDVVIERDQKTVSVDKNTSVVEKLFSYKEIIHGQTKNTQEFKALMKINPNEKIKELLLKTGFSIDDIWSDYLFGHDYHTKKMIYCLKKDGI